MFCSGVLQTSCGKPLNVHPIAFSDLASIPSINVTSAVIKIECKDRVSVFV